MPITKQNPLERCQSGCQYVDYAGDKICTNCGTVKTQSA